MNWSAVNLEAALGELALSVEFPETPDVSANVVARISARPAPWSRRGALVAAAAVIALVAPLVLSSGAREAVADFLGLGRVRVEVRGNVPEPTTTAPDIGLGREISLQEALERFGDFEYPRSVGEPDAVFLSDFGDITALVYEPSDALPEIDDIDAGLIFIRLPGIPPSGYLDKTLGADGTVRAVEVNGFEGLWTKGTEHRLTYEGNVRVSGNALIWQEGEITYRIESMLSLEATLEIARSIE
ncbi:MAG: hypothetical protein GEU71_04090 [Actinobacteria bacterium]|jgi:hypothetical protein|nr:hypothetical protein [Actinomycetota bacterium]